MSSSRSNLERIGGRVKVPQPAFDRLMRRRDRKRRNQRIVSAALALIVSTAAIGAAIRVFESGERRRPANTPITPQNVRTMRVLDTQFVGGHAISVEVSNGLAYVVSRASHPAKLVAFPTGCTTDCGPVWVADTGDADPRNGSAAAGGMVYVATNDLYAFSASCGSGGGTCEPAWVGRVDGRPFGPVLGNDAVYVVSKRRLYSFPTSCASVGGPCQPSSVSVELPHSSRGAAGFHHPVVVGDAVYLQGCCYPNHTEFVAFPTECGTGGATCRPLQGAAPPPPPPPVVADGKRFVQHGIALRAFPAECADPCTPLWTAAVAGTRNGLIAPGNGLLFVRRQYGGCCAGANEGGIYIFPTDCGSGNAPCKPLWTWGTGDQGEPRVPITSFVTSGNRLYATSGDGTLYVFGPGSVAAERGSAQPFSSGSTLAFYLGLAVVVAILMLVRRARRRVS